MQKLTRRKKNSNPEKADVVLVDGVLGERTRAPPDPPHLRGGLPPPLTPPLMSASGLPIDLFFNKILIQKPINAGGRH